MYLSTFTAFLYLKRIVRRHFNPQYYVRQEICLSTNNDHHDRKQ